MKNVILVSAILTFLASCTLMPQKAPSQGANGVGQKEINNKMMNNDAMMSGSMQKDTMNDDTMDDQMMSGADMMKKEDDTMEESMMDDDMTKKEAMIQADAMMKLTGYMNYDAAKVDAALASGQKVVFFFHATWCPSCKALDAAINADLGSIPSDVLIVKVDYDTSTELKKKYRVVGQHTTVMLNADGTEKSKKLGARSISEVLN